MQPFFRSCGQRLAVRNILLSLTVFLVSGMQIAQAAATATEGYYIVTRQDTRKCPWPLCGGVFVKQVNMRKTRCSDGALLDECYVATLDTQSLGWTAQQAADFDALFTQGQGLVRGRLYAVTNEEGWTVATLSASAAWQAQATAPQRYGIFYAIAANGIVCITDPCDSFTETPLNGRKPAQTIAGLRLDKLGLDAATLEEINAQLENGGLLAAGVPVPVTGPAGRSSVLAASQVYLPATGSTAQPAFLCNSGQTVCPTGQFCDTPAGSCGNAEAVGSCRTKPELCTMIYDPVCGCDGQTYSNDCARQSAGVALDHPGACP